MIKTILQSIDMSNERCCLRQIISLQAFLTLYNVRLSRTTKTPIIEIKYAAVAMKNGRPIHAAPL
jgi:hypothetical protein